MTICYDLIYTLGKGTGLTVHDLPAEAHIQDRLVLILITLHTRLQLVKASFIQLQETLQTMMLICVHHLNIYVCIGNHQCVNNEFSPCVIQCLCMSLKVTNKLTSKQVIH